MGVLGGAGTHALVGMRVWSRSLGLVASVGYELQSINSWLEIRYTALDYEASKVRVADFSMNVQGEKVDANHFALNFHYQF